MRVPGRGRVSGPGSNGKPVRRRKPKRTHRTLRYYNAVHNFLGPALFVAVSVVVGLMVVGVAVLEVAERHNPSVRSGWSALRWVVFTLVASPPFKVITPAG